MSESDEQERIFAYGNDEYECFKCPAVHAGFSPSEGDAVMTVADTFDNLVRQSKSKREATPGTVVESKAEKLWMRAIRKERNAQLNMKGVEQAEEVAKELRWGKEA